MRKNDDEKVHRIKSLNKKSHLSKKKIFKREIDKILYEYSNKHKKIFRSIKARSHNILSLNKTYNAKGHIFFGKKLSKKRKLEEEIYTISKEKRNIFRNALNKYKFDLEIYVPHNLTNREYSNKNYLVNKLINIEKMNQNIKEKIQPIERETKIFSKQYKLIKSNNKDHQKTYISNVEQIYQKHGIENIEYKNNENIFSPSFLLDKNFGKDQNKDASKYSKKNFDFKIDKNLLKKLNIASNKYQENSTYENNQNDKNKIKRFNSIQNWANINEKDEEMIKEILEEQKIMSMSKREYRIYNRKLKNDISIIKKRLYELNQNNNYNTIQNESSIKTQRKNFSNNNLKISLDITDRIKENIKKENIQPKNDIKKNNYEDNIFLSARGLDLETDFNKYLPSINSIVESKNDNEYKKKNKIVQGILKNKKNIVKKQKEIKQDKINQIYNYLNNKKDKNEFPYEQIEGYFRKHTKRKLPKIDPNFGSNIHGIFADFQSQVRDKSFSNIAKGNEYIKINLNKNYISNTNKSLENEIEKMDEKIENLHFTVLDKMLSYDKKALLNH